MKAAIPFVVFLAASALMGQSPSDRAYERHERQSRSVSNQPLPVQPAKLDLQKIKTEADELAKLAQAVPPEIDQAGNGVFPKVLGENLKKIEKLSKQLRRDLYF
jgi:hypothetical protein